MLFYRLIRYGSDWVLEDNQLYKYADMTQLLGAFTDTVRPDAVTMSEPYSGTCCSDSSTFYLYYP